MLLKDVAQMTPTERMLTGNKLGNHDPEDRRRRMRRGGQIYDPTAGMTLEEAEEWTFTCLQDPADYWTEVLGLELYPKQREILAALQRYPRVAVHGCNSSGKTFSLTPYSLWRLTVAQRLAIMEIAPTGSQSRGVYWRDMRGVYRGSKLAQQLLGDAEMHTLSFDVDDYRYAHAITPGDEMALRGYHADEMLFILDEGNGINATFFDAIGGTTASGEATIVQLGNPTDNSGIFYDSCTNPDLGWHVIPISAFDSPNLLSLEVPAEFDEISEAPGPIGEEDRRKLAYLGWLWDRWLKGRDRQGNANMAEYRILTDDVTLHQTRRMYVAEHLKKWAFSGDSIGQSSWYGRILGQFPPEAERQLISRAWLDRAKDPTEFDLERGVINWGIDPSGMGQDEYVLCGVQMFPYMNEPHRVIVLEAFQGAQCYQQVLNAMKPYMEFTRGHQCGQGGRGGADGDGCGAVGERLGGAGLRVCEQQAGV